MIKVVKREAAVSSSSPTPVDTKRRKVRDCGEQASCMEPRPSTHSQLREPISPEEAVARRLQHGMKLREELSQWQTGMVNGQPFPEN